MYILPTAAQLNANPALFAVCVSKLVGQIRFNHDDLTRAQYDYALANDIKLENIRAYSPVVQESMIDSFVPESWPGGVERDEEGEIVKRLTFREYTQCFEVGGGWVARFCAARKGDTGAIRNPNWTEFKVWVNTAGGFLTQAEFEAIRTVDPVD